MQLHLLARYPFLPEAGRFIEEQGPALEDLLRERVYASARVRGRARVLSAMEDAEVPPRAVSAGSSQRELLEELLSYAYARILVSALADAFVVRRHALAEAVRVRAFLAAEDDREAVAAAALAVGLDFRVEGDAFAAHFTEFLKQSVHLKDLDWKLVRQPLSRGVVAMDRVTVARLVQEALRRRIEEELPRKLPPELVKELDADLAPLREVANAHKEKYSTETFGKVDLSLLPPCMGVILNQLHRGENVAHNARFAITTFLHKIGMSSDDIMKLFSQAPDFKEELTRYQVEHITGKSSGTTYSVPGCDNLQTFNLCFADDLCRSKTKAERQRVNYPGDYYRYMQEAKAPVDAIVARVPISGKEGLVRALATNYGMLKAAQEIASAIDRIDPARVRATITERKLPVGVDEATGALAFDEKDPYAILRLLRAQPLTRAPASPTGA